MLQKVDDDTARASEELKTIDTSKAEEPRRRFGFFRALLQAAFMIAIIAGSAFIANKMIEGKPPTKKRPAFKTVYTIETVTAQKADNQPKFVSYGQVIAARSVELRSLVSGEILSVNPNLQPGATVKKGASLVEIDRFSYEGALREAQSNLNEAKARMVENEARIALEKGKLASATEQLQLAEADLARAAKLRQRGTSTQQQLDSRNLVVSQRKQTLALSKDTITVEQARLEQLKASLSRLEWRVDQAKRNVKSATLVAPFTGIVRSSTAEAGRLVSANDVVVAMYEAGSLEVKFTLTDAQFGRLQTSDSGLVGRSVDITWTVGGGSYSWPGIVDRAGAEISSSRGGVEFFARVVETNNPVTIRPGAFVEVRVPDVVFKDSVRVPDTAIYGANTVYTSVDGKLVEKKVTIAAFDGETALISSGVEAGDEILITRITEVSEGLAVRKEGDPNPARGQATGPRQGDGAFKRPKREEMAKILKANNIDRDGFNALSRLERRQMIAAWRDANSSN